MKGHFYIGKINSHWVKYQIEITICQSKYLLKKASSVIWEQNPIIVILISSSWWTSNTLQHLTKACAFLPLTLFNTTSTFPPLSFSYTTTYKRSHAHTLASSLNLSIPHTHTLSHTHTFFLAHTLFLSHRYTHFFFLTPILPLSHTLSLNDYHPPFLSLLPSILPLPKRTQILTTYSIQTNSWLQRNDSFSKEGVEKNSFGIC